MSRKIKLNDDRHGATIDIDVLVRSRMLIQANSGAGKSWTLRRILEQSHPHIQQIIIDVEGEFHTLRDKFDYIYASAGKGGDCLVTVRAAPLMARRFLELQVSAIVDIYELKAHERMAFVKDFLQTLVNAPKNLWHPLLIVLDEAHVFCPEKGQASSAGAVIDIMTRGRKRGFCGLLATQRLSKLHKDAAAEANNKLIGRSSLDVDMKRAADELGFSSHEEKLSLRTLANGEFYVFGPAISPVVEKVQVGGVTTTHPEPGKSDVRIAPPKERVLKIMAQITDLPGQAEEELRTEAELRQKIRDLERQARTVDKTQPATATPDPKVMERAIERAIQKLQRALHTDLTRIVRDLEGAHSKLEGVGGVLSAARAKVDDLIFHTDTTQGMPADKHVEYERTIPLTPTRPRPPAAPATVDNGTGEISLRAGARRMLAVLAQWYPEGLTEGVVRAQAGMKRSGTYDSYKSALRSQGVMELRDGKMFATQTGVDYCGSGIPAPPQSYEEVRAIWDNKLRKGARRMLDVLVSHPEGLSRAELAEGAGMAESGTFDSYLSALRTARLITAEGGVLAPNAEVLLL